MNVVISPPAPRTVQIDAHTASKEEEQTQAQTPSATGPITTRYDFKVHIYTNVSNVQGSHMSSKTWKIVDQFLQHIENEIRHKMS